MTRTRMAIADLTGDLVLYRDLEPCDATLPGLSALRTQLGMPPGRLPRKRDADYARVILALLEHIRTRRVTPPLRNVLVIGDTDNDRAVAHYLRSVAPDLAVYAFIGVDRLSAPPAMTWNDGTADANRWALIDDWLTAVAQRLQQPDQQPLFGPQTALLIDIDKTLLGPRGRGDAPIDAARAAAAEQVAVGLLGATLDRTAFREYYATLCRKEFHVVTLDNQDYTVYATLLLAAGCLTIADLQQGMADGSLSEFTCLLAFAAPRLPATLTALHAEIDAACRAGDPTPFKAFRRAEFAATVARMTAGELTLCAEVVAVARRLLAAGAVCIAASDKPAEASLPAPDQLAAGLQPLHRTPVDVT